jgi:Spy/CpxP family protein refolding chaperone
VNTWKVILATLVIFVAGLVTGAVVVWHSGRVFLPSRQRPGGHPVQQINPGGMRIELLRRMQRELDLTPEQHAKIEKLLKESQERTRKIMEPVAPQLREELRHTREAFRTVLTPEQQQRFDQLLRRPHHGPLKGPGRATNSGNI